VGFGGERAGHRAPECADHLVWTGLGRRNGRKKTAFRTAAFGLHFLSSGWVTLSPPPKLQLSRTWASYIKDSQPGDRQFPESAVGEHGLAFYPGYWHGQSIATGPQSTVAMRRLGAFPRICGSPRWLELSQTAAGKDAAAKGRRRTNPSRRRARGRRGGGEADHGDPLFDQGGQGGGSRSRFSEGMGSCAAHRV